MGLFLKVERIFFAIKDKDSTYKMTQMLIMEDHIHDHV